jgi:hypothetical protein
MSEELEQVVAAVTPDDEFCPCAQFSVDELIEGYGAVDDVGPRQLSSVASALKIGCCLGDEHDCDLFDGGRRPAMQRAGGWQAGIRGFSGCLLSRE